MKAYLPALYAEIFPLMLQIVGLALAALLARAAETARARWGIEIEARHREALHSALMSGIRAALGRGLAGQAAVDAAITYASQSVPQALDRLDPTADVLIDLARSKLTAALESSGGK